MNNPNKTGKNTEIIAIKKSDKKVFIKMVESHYDELYVYSKSLCRDELLAKDLVQDVFFKLWEKRESLNTDTLLKGWLYKAIKNKYLDHIKKHSRETFFLEKTFSDTLSTVVQQDYNENLDRKLELLEQEIQVLPKKCKQVLIMSKKEGLTNIEIANYLGVSLKTVEGHLTKAFKILKDNLNGKYQFLFTFLSFNKKH
ncbi:sigma-70 family RNA polymerase sigma factor [Formosa sediminum]|uniref:Sigma-70 family RNA polymerase sigma factor n=1 Tax=Formosa sediminum TaxID=2594004 RepID=A0A516GTR2_9FLAO|nr:sigma-70 family RNA polymerase sigma factor [Formosa sediminum]QDO94903.1 sigma-70 family RNA polymerase sigma factor [Formosa sediminum]